MIYRLVIQMETKAGLPTLKYDNLVISSRGVAEADGKKVVLFIPLADVERVTLKFGRADHRPILSLSIGVVLLLVGIWGLTELCLAPRGLRYEMGMIFFGVVGGSLTFDSLKQRFFLEIQTSKSLRRLVFSKQAGRADILAFCNKVGSAYPFKIAEDL